MRNPNDMKLAENVDEVDLILGGHDHVYEVKQVSNTETFTGCFSKVCH
jgi:5'-nucleotidase